MSEFTRKDVEDWLKLRLKIDADPGIIDERIREIYGLPQPKNQL